MYFFFFRNVRQWRQRNKNQKNTEDEATSSEPTEMKEDNTSDKENENTNNNVNGDVDKIENKDGKKDDVKEVTSEGKEEQENSQDSIIPKPSEDIDIIDNTECKFNVNSFKLVYVVNSESYLYKRMALKRAKEVRLQIQNVVFWCKLLNEILSFERNNLLNQIEDFFQPL